MWCSYINNNGRHLILFEMINHFLVEQVLWVEMFSLFGFTALFEIFMWPRHRSTLRTNKQNWQKHLIVSISLIIKSRSYFDRKTRWMYVRANDIFWVDITSHCCNLYRSCGGIFTKHEKTIRFSQQKKGCWFSGRNTPEGFIHLNASCPFIQTNKINKTSKKKTVKKKTKLKY